MGWQQRQRRGLSVSVMGCGEDGRHPLEEPGLEGVKNHLSSVFISLCVTIPHLDASIS